MTAYTPFPQFADSVPWPTIFLFYIFCHTAPPPTKAYLNVVILLPQFPLMFRVCHVLMSASLCMRRLCPLCVSVVFICVCDGCAPSVYQWCISVYATVVPPLCTSGVSLCMRRLRPLCVSVVYICVSDGCAPSVYQWCIYAYATAVPPLCISGVYLCMRRLCPLCVSVVYICVCDDCAPSVYQWYIYIYIYIYVYATAVPPLCISGVSLCMRRLRPLCVSVVYLCVCDGCAPSVYQWNISVYATAVPPLHVHHLMVFRPTTLFSFLICIHPNKTKGLCCVTTCSLAMILQPVTLHTRCLFTMN